MDLLAPTHLFVLLLVILIIFGPSKLGDVGSASSRPHQRLAIDPGKRRRLGAKGCG
jgi:hypothetical protein